ncbi:MAG: hypothetical protein K0U47_03405 [Epsilonproteobacteria bacterium]|nr:hypothetical protein [Campylobacterota bacterium]
MKITNILIIISLSLTLISCSSMKPLNAKKLSKIEKIGVVVVDGNQLSLRLIGTTIFNNELKYQDISDWNLSSFINNEVGTQLKTRSNLTTIDINYNIDEIRHKTALKNEQGEVWEFIDSGLKKSLAPIMQKNKLDYILLVVGSYINQSGIYIFKRQFLKSVHDSQLQIFYRLRLFHKNEMKEICRTIIAERIDIDPIIWEDGKRKITTKELNRLEMKTKKRLHSAIEKRLISMGLIQ